MKWHFSYRDALATAQKPCTIISIDMIPISYVMLTSNLPTLTSLIGVSVNKLNYEAEALFSNIFNCVKMGSAIFQSSNLRI